MKVKVKEPEDKEDLVDEESENEEEDAEDDDESPVETDNVGDPSVEINVEELIHELEIDGITRAGKEHAAKRRLEELMEKKRSKRDLEDFDDYDI